MGSSDIVSGTVSISSSCCAKTGFFDLDGIAGGAGAVAVAGDEVGNEAG